MQMSELLLSIVIPLHNESANIDTVYQQLQPVVDKVSDGSYEIIYVNDGSSDNTAELVAQLHSKNSKVKLLQLSRRFGKELALAAGIGAATGKAVLTLDGDGQHPIERIPDFIDAWKAGAQVVIGVRTANSREGFIKKFGSKVFHTLFNRLSGAKLVPGSTDFRLIDRTVQQEFVKFTEPNSMTRGLIDWLGFKRVYITYTANPRVAGEAGYTVSQLVKLAANSFVSLSPFPLYISGYLGVFITTGAFLLGLFVLIEQIILNDPWHLKFTGTAMLSILVLFLVGILLVSQGILALYISHIHAQSKRRPLFVVDHRGSLGLPKTDD